MWRLLMSEEYIARRYEAFKESMEEYGDFTEEELQSMFESEMTAEMDL